MSIKINLSRLASSVTVDQDDKTVSFSARQQKGLDQSMLKNMTMDDSFYDLQTPVPM